MFHKYLTLISMILIAFCLSSCITVNSGDGSIFVNGDDNNVNVPKNDAGIMSNGDNNVQQGDLSQDTSDDKGSDAKDISPVNEATPAGNNKDVFTANDDSYILSKSATNELVDADVRGLSKEELRLARNEIYARHGRRFKDKELQQYFDSKEWYTPTLPLGTEPTLSKTEIYNVDFIKKYE